jgi:hypothetical protein
MPPLENAERAEKLHSGPGCVPANSKPIKLFVRGSYSEFLTHNAFFRLSRMIFVIPSKDLSCPSDPLLHSVRIGA